jgi:hypothetical protein
MTPLTLPDVALLVGMIQPGGRSGRAWAYKSRIILALASFVDGDWFNAPDVERLTGIRRNFARELLGELEAQKVITRDGGPAGSSARVFWCELNADWRQWQVEWAFEQREVETRLAWTTAHRARSPLDRLFSRRVAPRFVSVIAVLGRRDNARMIEGFAPESRWHSTAISDHVSRRQAPRKTRDRSKEVSLLARADEEISSLDIAAQRQKEEGEAHPRWGMVRATYARKAGVRVVYGGPAAALARLLAEHGHEALMVAIDQAPDELGVKLLVDELAHVLTHGPVPDLEPLPEPVPINAEAKRANLEQLVATYQQDGGEAPEELLAELARWQTERVPAQEAVAP